jgi:multicomponent Na+:H+ antiporter subunit D
MGEPIAPFLLFFCGGLLAWALPPKARRILLVLVPVVGLWNLSGLGSGAHWHVSFMDYTLTMMRVDKLSLIFGYIFHIAAFIGFIYAFHLDDRVEQIAIMIHVGSALGIVFAGDLVTLFIFWEVLSIASVFIIWARRRPEATRAGFRYLLVHAAVWLFLLGGIVLRASEVGSIDFVHMELADLATFLIFMGFGINCAWPGLHAWLTDAYPESTVTGTVFLRCIHNKGCCLCPGKGFCRDKRPHLGRSPHDSLPHFLRCHRERPQKGSLLQPHKPGWLHGMWDRDRNSPSPQWRHKPRLQRYIVQGPSLSWPWGAVMYRTGRIHATDLGGLYRDHALDMRVLYGWGGIHISFPPFQRICQ